MARMSGKVSGVVLGETFAGFTCDLAAASGSGTERFLVYHDVGSAPIGQGEMLRRSLTVATLQRALEAGSWITVDFDADSATRVYNDFHKTWVDPRLWYQYARIWLSLTEMQASEQSSAELLTPPLDLHLDSGLKLGNL